MSQSQHVIELLRDAGLDPDAVYALCRATVDEDLSWGPDITTIATVAVDAVATGSFVARDEGTLAGVPIAAAVLDLVSDGAIEIEPVLADGARVVPGDVILRVTGPTRSLLTAERTALNLLCQLSGVATLTATWVDAIAGTDAMIRDTRKTTPGLRALEKYAVRCGGGRNHRMGLGDAALIKDNHVAAAGSITAAYEAVRAADATIAVEVECDTLAQVAEALAVGAELILLDNMSTADLRSAVALRIEYPSTWLEASGGLTLDTARDVAATGVQFLSIGALTHSAPALDIALDL